MFASKDLFFSKPSGYQISRSVRLRSSASAYLNRTPASAGNRTTWTWSAWIKRGLLGSGSNYALFGAGTTAPNYGSIRFSSDSLQWFTASGGSGNVVTTQVFRDPSAWYHIVVALDTTQATASNRLKMYVNGVQVTSFSTSTYPSQNYNGEINSTYVHAIGSTYTGTYQELFDGYLTEVNFIDGQALTPSSFGQTNTITGVWQPIKYTGTYGTNGFYLNFSDNSNNTATTIGKDYSGNGNNWTPNNISVTAGVTYDSMLDVPTLFPDGGNGRGNYAVLNAVDPSTSSTLTNGNLTAAISSATGSSQAGSIVVSTGKWYWEVDETSVTNQSARIGILRGNLRPSAVSVSTNPNGVYYTSDATKIVDGTATAYGSSWSTTGASYNIGVALDADAGTVTFYLGGVSQGAITLPSNTEGWKAHAMWGSIGGTGTFNFNFGQRPFTYTPPTGFVALNTQNLPTPTISNGANYMAATTYSGDGTNPRTITNSVNNIGFQPDFIWAKVRSTTYSNTLYDSVRGGANALFSDTTAAESTNYANGQILAFNSNGFNVNAGVVLNQSGQTYVTWQWKAGTTSSSNTNGSITSTVSVGATQGFSVVTFTEPASGSYTFGHGLGVTPSMFIVKERNVGGTNWVVWHNYWQSVDPIPTKKGQYLNSTLASFTTGSDWLNSLSSTTIGITTGQVTSGGSTMVAYCFSEVAGYSKFGSYTGNGSADGPFIFTGFRPRFVLTKSSSSGGAGFDWSIYDSSRNTYNVGGNYLWADLSNAEVAADGVDFLSNGFKIRNTSGQSNSSSVTYIYIAFAENPFKNSLAR